MDVDSAAIRKARSRMALSLRELGERAGVGFATISRIERGAQRPHPTTLRKLAEALRVAPEDLLKRRHPAPPPGNLPPDA